ncbi:hypothetical protein [Fervidicoccus fontis]|nr:hypothetical protein [Fervidicoccus fontis]
MISIRDTVAYILSIAGCTSPFRISRMLVLANWKMLKEKGTIALRFKVDGFQAGFAVPEIEEIKRRIKDGSERCIKINEQKKCFEYVCEEKVELPREVSDVIQKVFDEIRSLDDISLNRIVVRDPHYPELLKRGGFHEG